MKKTFITNKDYLKIGQNNVNQTVILDLAGHTLTRVSTSGTPFTSSNANGHVIDVFGGQHHHGGGRQCHHY